MIVRRVLACHNAEGCPDLTFVKVRCTQAQYHEGDHYAAAQAWANADNYEAPFVVFDEHDVPAEVLELFVWKSASIVTVQKS